MKITYISPKTASSENHITYYTYYQARVWKSKGWSRVQLRSMIFGYSVRLEWWNPCFDFNFFCFTNYLFDFVRLPSYPGMHHVRASDANIFPFQTMLSQRSVFLFTWSKTFGRERLTSLLASLSRFYDRGREKERENRLQHTLNPATFFSRLSRSRKVFDYKQLKSG